MHVKVGRVGQLVIVTLAARLSCAAASLSHMTSGNRNVFSSETRAPSSQRDHPGDRRSETASGLPCLLLVHLATGAEAATPFLVASVHILQ